MKSLEIRQKFFEFFKQRGHTVVESSSLIPAQDPTLLFANAGMNQFKDVFLGKEKRSYTRAVSIQKCMRAGGKHNDLENVGFTKRHLTFFEMMGNFSFGDYFKKDAIRFAWDFVTKELKLNSELLYVTVYKNDDQAYDIWHKEIGLPAQRIVRLGEVDNFWQMGEVGPCGPCTEIYIDRGLSFGCGKAECAPGCSCDRFLEFWNLVFMQFDRQSDGKDKPLERVGVDTGMGLERLCAIMQGKDSVFETDLFEPIIQEIVQLTKKNYSNLSDQEKAPFRVIADHVRAATFLIADGCAPSNEGRGYVLRKVIRRAALFMQKLTADNIIPPVAQAVIESMGSIYPELITARTIITTVLTNEVDRFAHNLIQGQHILAKYIQEQQAEKIITGAQVFKLYDTYGFPLELTKVIAAEHGYQVDEKEFEKYMAKQREQSSKKEDHAELILPANVKTEFTGYQEMQTNSAIAALLLYNNSAGTIGVGEECWIVPHKSPFYVECGGQVNDKGWIIFDSNVQVPIEDLKKINGAIAIKIHAPIELIIGQKITQIVDRSFRLNTMKNHTATHLLQAALIQVLGKQVKQAGSLVTADYLRFDFTYHEALTPLQIRMIEDIVNTKIMDNIPLLIRYSTLKEATDQGVIAFFGEKYNPEHVRVVQVPGFSAELCGGTHVKATGDIGCFKITESTALSSGQRRMVALTGPKAVELYQDSFATVKGLTQEFKVQYPEVSDAVKKMKEQLKQTLAQLKKLRKYSAQELMPKWIANVQMIKDMPFLCLCLEQYPMDELKDIVTALMQKKAGMYFVLSADLETTSFYMAISPEHAAQFDSSAFAQWLKEQGLRAGGKGNSLQGSGPAQSAQLCERIKHWVEKNIKI